MEDLEVNICSQETCSVVSPKIVLSNEVERVVKPSLLKLYYKPIVHQLVDIKDMFSIISDKSKMDALANAKQKQEKYLNDIFKSDGDVHYFRKQSFHIGHKREVYKSIEYKLFIYNI